ncbi:MAG TPA: hypothetical protein VFS43_07175 [Polyangiaceae bacterium]|nr:hypothetical protein [Polyangiaceae bacterium]
MMTTSTDTMSGAPSRGGADASRAVAGVQAGFYAATGLWPVVSPGTFQAVTGPKREVWLVKTTGLLITAVGAALAVGARRPRVSPETATLGVASAAVLAAVDLVYVARRRISPVYLLDAVAELALVGAWALARRRAGPAPSGST